jgi:hypothetical protein
MYYDVQNYDPIIKLYFWNMAKILQFFAFNGAVAYIDINFREEGVKKNSILKFKLIFYIFFGV